MTTIVKVTHHLFTLINGFSFEVEVESSKDGCYATMCVVRDGKKAFRELKPRHRYELRDMAKE